MRPLAIALALMLLLGGCRQAADKSATPPVPLPRAWPRTNTYPAAYSPVAEGVDIEIVSGLEVTRHISAEGHNWFDIVYPAYRATLYLSDILPGSEEKTAEACENRLERMALNTGGRQSTESSFVTPAGYRAVVLSTPSGCITPVQFVATGRQRVVSGAFTLDRVPGSADSLAPTLRAVERDIIHLINSLR